MPTERQGVGTSLEGRGQDEQDGVGCYLGRNDLWGMGEPRSDFNTGKSEIREPMQK